MTEEEEIKYIKEYLHSNYSDEHLIQIGASEDDINYIKTETFQLKDKLSKQMGNLVISNEVFSFILQAYIDCEKNENYDRIFSMKARVFILLDDSMLKNTIDFNFFKSHYEEICRIPSNRELSQSGINESFNSAYICKCIGVELYFSLSYPNLYTLEELKYIDSVLSSLNDINEYKRNFEHFEKILNKRISDGYNNTREYQETIKNNTFSRFYEKSDREIDNDNLSCKLSFNYLLLYTCNVIVEKNKEEYKLWKKKSLTIKYILKYFKAEISFYLLYEDYIENNMLYWFFNTLNIPLAFAKDQIDYIREMAPKLRISSYLNEEYAKYKKLYNPDAREFDFGVDEPEEETTIEEQLLPESEQIEDEKKEKLHLGPLSHFTKPKLIKLLEKFRDRKEPFVHKETKQKNWLFVFGMKGDTPPKGFEKIKWEAKYNGRPAKGALIDFLEVLGYDIDKLYEVDSIKILNECFECYNPDNKLVPIDQNDFHYKKRTKERDHSKTFYDHFKRIIENIEKEA